MVGDANHREIRIQAYVIRSGRQYNRPMYRIAVFLAMMGTTCPSMLFASEEQPFQEPGVNERLNQALGAEGGVQVYKDQKGNVGTIIDLPGGTRRITVQPPQSPSMNLGPPLQLDNPPLQFPPAITSPHPLSPELPHKAH